jgi:hypothetical protein
MVPSSFPSSRLRRQCIDYDSFLSYDPKTTAKSWKCNHASSGESLACNPPQSKGHSKSNHDSYNPPSPCHRFSVTIKADTLVWHVILRLLPPPPVPSSSSPCTLRQVFEHKSATYAHQGFQDQPQINVPSTKTSPVDYVPIKSLSLL